MRLRHESLGAKAGCCTDGEQWPNKAKNDETNVDEMEDEYSKEEKWSTLHP